MPKARSLVFVNAFYFLTIYLIFFLLKNAPLAKEHIYDSLLICIKSVIPSLFPFMVLCYITVNSGLGERLGHYLGRPFSFLFGISADSAAVFILGCLFGYPLGTSNAVSLYKRGLVSKADGEKLICFCSNTGPAFITGVVAPAIGSTRGAFAVYLSQVLAATVIGICLRGKSTSKPAAAKSSTVLSPEIFIKAITESVLPMLNICSFVAFFSCISCSVEEILSAVNASPLLCLFAKGFLEITNGFSAASLCRNNIQLIIICAFFVGWSGLSVVLQGCNIAYSGGLDCKKFVVAKLIQGILSAVICLLLCKLFNLY